MGKLYDSWPKWCKLWIKFWIVVVGSGKVPDQLVELSLKRWGTASFQPTGDVAGHWRKLTLRYCHLQAEHLEKLPPPQAKMKEIEQLPQSVANGFLYFMKREKEMWNSNSEWWEQLKSVLKGTVCTKYSPPPLAVCWSIEYFWSSTAKQQSLQCLKWMQLSFKMLLSCKTSKTFHLHGEKQIRKGKLLLHSLLQV